MPDPHNYYGAIDLGGTKILSLVADGEGRVYGEDSRPSLPHDGLEVVLDRISESLAAAEADASLSRANIATVGIASAGTIDVDRGIVTSAPQLPDWRDVPLRDMMAERLGRSVVLENDASAAALGEYMFGSGKGTRHMLYITVSTGVGGGVVIDGDLYRGASGAAGELGHITIDSTGPICGCGGRGHLESLSSGTSIARRGKEMVAAGQAPVLARLIEGGDGLLTAKMMHDAALEGDESSVKIFQEAGHYLGIGLANFINIFNPEVIAIGGGVGANVGDLMLDPARDSMKKQGMEQPLQDVRLTIAELGGRVGALGMVAVIQQQ